MRFFLEFVSCCGSATQRPAVQKTSSQPLEEEEERSLVPPSRQRHRKKRGRLGTSSAAGPEWRPSLGSISEDNIVPRRERGDDRNGKLGSESNVKRRSGGGAAKVHHRNYGDDYKRASVPTIMPPFSPTPFMF